MFTVQILIVRVNPALLNCLQQTGGGAQGYYLLSGNTEKYCDGIIAKQLTQCKKKFIISVLKQNCTLKESPPQLQAAD